MDQAWTGWRMMTSVGNIDSESFCLSELFGEVSYEIDYYQRDYTWGEEEVRTLVRDLCSLFDEWTKDYQLLRRPKRAPQYFLGPFVYYEPPKSRRRFLVDGQQRFVTLHLIFLHLRSLVAGIDEPSADRLNRVIRRHDQSFCIGIKDHEPVLQAVCDGREYEPGPGDSLSRRNLWARSNDIGPLLKDALEAGQYRRFVDWLLDRVVLVGIQAPSRNSGYRIFETMNDRGAHLTAVDLLKSYLLSNVREDEEKLNQRWRDMLAELTIDREDREAPARFIKAALLARHARPLPSSDHESIERNLNFWVRKNHGYLRLDTPERYFCFVDELLELARCFRPLLAASREHKPGLETVFYNERNGLSKQMVAILAAIQPTDTPTVAIEKARRIAAFLDRWYVLQVLYDMPVQSQDISNIVHNHLVPRLRKTKTADAVTNALGEMISQDRSSILDAATFELRGNNPHQVRYLLARITAYVEKSCGRPDDIVNYLDSGRYHIEHLWPNRHDFVRQEIPETLVFHSLRNRFGALGLLPGPDNSSLNDWPLNQKVDHYAKYNILLGILSPHYNVRNPQLRRFIGAHGLDRLLRSFGSQYPMRTVIETRHQLYLKLCEMIWNPVELHISEPTPHFDTRRAYSAPTVGSPAPIVSKKARRRTEVARMVQAGIIAPGTRIVLSYKGADHWATIDADGGIVLHATGAVYGKADEAGAAVRGTKTCDGLRQWHIQQERGRISLRDLRDLTAANSRTRARR
jgi:Protein of unknown function DUF262/Restriction Enzyme Adenine Methylase Associated